MSVCLLYFYGAKKTGDPIPALQNHAKSVRQLIPSLIKSSECKGVFQSFLIKLHMDNGTTYV
jgi:hypothetical protein